MSVGSAGIVGLLNPLETHLQAWSEKISISFFFEIDDLRAPSQERWDCWDRGFKSVIIQDSSDRGGGWN
jgi:hypothetical protein